MMIRNFIYFSFFYYAYIKEYFPPFFKFILSPFFLFFLLIVVIFKLDYLKKDNKGKKSLIPTYDDITDRIYNNSSLIKISGYELVKNSDRLETLVRNTEIKNNKVISLCNRTKGKYNNWDALLNNIREDGYKPEKHTYPMILTDNKLWDGHHRITLMICLYGEEFVFDVKKHRFVWFDFSFDNLYRNHFLYILFSMIVVIPITYLAYLGLYKLLTLIVV
jgi:hypothetical protein